jgi:hypothetical protein
MQARRALVSAALAASVLTAAGAVAGPPPAPNASFCGVVRVTSRNCVTVPGSIGNVGRVFDISGASPLPRRNSTISGSGVVRGISRCSSANRRLTHVSWRRVSVCPLARPLHR